MASMFFYGIALGDAWGDTFRGRGVVLLIAWIITSGILVFSFRVTPLRLRT